MNLKTVPKAIIFSLFSVFICAILISFNSSCATNRAQAYKFGTFVECAQDPGRQKLRSKELQAIVQADQADREGAYTGIDWAKVLPRDEARRKRVGEIFGEGCFKEAADYAAAALVYQHGNVPDHFFQTFLWAKKAVDLGDTSKKGLVALGLDRYLVNSGHKQLFGTQLSGVDSKGTRWCIEPIEATFPKSIRAQYMKISLNEYIATTLNATQSKQSPEDVHECPHPLQSSPARTIPGFW